MNQNLIFKINIISPFSKLNRIDNFIDFDDDFIICILLQKGGIIRKFNKITK